MNLKKIFITGIILLLPTLITIFLLLLAFRFLSNNIAQPLGGLVLAVLQVAGINLNEYATFLKPLIGFPLALGIIFIVGYITATFVGRRIFGILEKNVLQKIPIVSLIYPYAKQLIDLFVGDKKKAAFKSVVSIQYPRPGIYAIGFITSEGLSEIRNVTGKQCVTVFIPSSPTPFTGWTIMVPEDEVIKLNMTVDEAIRFVVSGGILTPNNSGNSDELPKQS
ncbi:MAG: DUF502 domain-containing protein [Planctomycetota bacterium]